MTTLSELIGRSIKPETKAPNNPTMKIVAAQIQTKSEKPHDKYEADVFNYLLDNKDSLGIKSVVKFTALIVDGALELIGGKRLAIEIKYRMNWEKACQAEWQFRKFLTRHAPSNPVDGGVVFFEDISGDWNRKAKSRLLVNGWSNWYRSYSKVDDLSFDLLRLRDGKLESFPFPAKTTEAP